jgi:diguanylate cyclase (GGDEF)-like protein
MSVRLREEAERLRHALAPHVLFSEAQGALGVSVRALRVMGVVAALAIVGATAVGARELANNDAANARRTFQSASGRVAATVSLSLLREEDLTLAASTFMAAKPTATSGEFTDWTKFAQAARRFPELRRLDWLALVPVVPASSVRTLRTGSAGFATTFSGSSARFSASAPTSTASPVVGATRANAPIVSTASSGLQSAHASATTGIASLVIVSPSLSRTGDTEGGARCVIVASLAHVPAPTLASRDLCTRDPALMRSRDSGHATFAKVSLHGRSGVQADTPVYRSGSTPTSTAARRTAFVGWLRTVVDPTAVLERALAGQPDMALSVRRRGAFGATFATPLTGAASRAGAQSTTFSLHGGWELQTTGAPADATVLGNGDSAALLIGGTIIGLLLSGFALLADAQGPREDRAGADGRGKHEDLYDRLTGLPNRALTLDRAERMIARGGRESGVLAGALLIDIDWFADINERFGRAAGDKVLVAVAQRMRSTMRAVDSVGRMGGDEFVVLVEASRGVKFDAVARRVIEALHEPIELEGFGPSFVITASVGVAFGRYKSVEDLLADARLALVSAKSAGKDRYTLFNANMRSVVEGRGVLEGELSAALADGQLFLLYEPIRDLRTSAVVGFEGLVQWHHPEKGVMPADEFASLAEDSGLVVPIGRFALEEACTRAAEWNLSEHRVAVAVKVSATQLHRDGFATDVRRALQMSGLEPALLTLEIEEMTLTDDLDAARPRLAGLRELGVTIAIDDFGNGYAFRSDLQNMPIGCIKVDRASLAESEGDDYRNWLLEAILSFGRDLSMNVIATGVRYEPQLGALQAMGFPMAQGPAVGEPVRAEAVRALLDAPLAGPHEHAAAPAASPVAPQAHVLAAHAVSGTGTPTALQVQTAPQSAAHAASVTPAQPTSQAHAAAETTPRAPSGAQPSADA